MSASQQLFDGSIYLVEVGLLDGTPGNKDEVPAPDYGFQPQPDRLPDKAFAPVTFDCLAEPAAGGETEAAIPQTIGQSTKHQKRMGPGAALFLNLLKLCALRYPIFSLQTQTVNLFRPLRRRALSTFRPSLVRIRARKPCTRLRRLFLG
jgi:hypothetical protein